MTTNNTPVKTYENQIITLDIDANGEVTQQLTPPGRTLDNTLLSRLCPGIKIAIVNLPGEYLEGFEESQVEDAMRSIVHNNVQYEYVGGTNSSQKKKQVIFAESQWSPFIIKRLQHSPQNALTYLGILLSDCKVLIEDSDTRVLVVKDSQLGTNDSSGYVSHALFKKIQRTYYSDVRRKEYDRLQLLWRGSLPEQEKNRKPTDAEEEEFKQLAEKVAKKNFIRSNCFYQFRLAFSGTQAKGAFKIIKNDVVELLGADIVLPESAVKPSLNTPTEASEHGEIRRFRGPIVLGVRDISRQLDFESSYTLVQHAPHESFAKEIIPYAVKTVQKVNESIRSGNYKELLELLGLNDPDKAEDAELRVIEAALLADPTGEIVKHPHINNQINRLLTRWAYKTCTGGGFRLPAFALAHDGYLVAHKGRIYSGSDWMPKDTAICALAARSSLCVRYPIRMLDDLLPVTHMSEDDVLLGLTARLILQDCPDAYEFAKRIASQQLWLEGTYTMHSETASKNGGDFDFDWIAVLIETLFPLFTQARLAIANPFHQEKTKAPKANSPWHNAVHVAIKAGNNRIGEITDLITSCIAAKRDDLARELVPELQKGLDSLKHNTRPDYDVIKAIKEAVPQAPWLLYKKKERISDLPLHLDVGEGDRIGQMYNIVRKHIEDLLTVKLPIEDFKGLITGNKFDREMFEECRFVNQAFAAKVGSTSDRQAELQAELEKVNAAWEAYEKDPQTEVRKHQRLGKIKSQPSSFGSAQSAWVLPQSPEQELRKQLRTARNRAQTAVFQGQKDAKDQMEAITSTIRVWAAGKTGNRMGWCQALNRVVSGGMGAGSILWAAFPQEMIIALAKQKGGVASRVALPDTRGKSIQNDSDGKVFLVEELEDGNKRERFIFQFKDGKFSFLN